MENIIFYTLLLVCIILLFIVGYNFTKINKYKSNAQFWELSFNDVSKRVKELTTKNTDLNTLISIRDETITKQSDRIELLKTTISERDKIVKDHTLNIEVFKEKYNELEKTIESHIMTIDEKQEKIIEQAKALQKQNDELTIKNTTIESLTNALEDKHKQDKPFNVLESLEDLIPRKEGNKTKKYKLKDK